LRDDEHIKSLLEARLKSLHLREEAVKEKEHELEAANAKLHHDLDEQEYNNEHDIEAMAHARDVASESKEAAVQQAEDETSKKERQFEETTLKAAKDEIARLKDELASKESREAHAEQILVEQEKSIETEDKQATELEQKAKFDLNMARSEIEVRLTEAQHQADEIVAKAHTSTQSIREHFHAEGMEDSQELIQQGQASISEAEKRLQLEETQTKKLGNQLRIKMDKMLKEEEDKVREHLKAERERLEAEIHKKVDVELVQMKKESETRLDDVSAGG
jgi:F0F1-type ATP synthase membrane subunit b/b'